MLITDGVHQIDGIKGAHSYLVTGSEPFLVDTGLPGQELRILEYIQKNGVDPSQLKGIILTHYDVDHVGSVAGLAQLTQAPVLAHPADIPFILNQAPRLGLKRWLPLMISPFYGRIRAPQRIDALAAETFCDWEIIHTPGHTPGHIVLYRNGIGIVGDLLVGGNVQLAPWFFTWDSKQMQDSVAQLIARPLRWILPGHGPVTPAAHRWLDSVTRAIR